MKINLNEILYAVSSALDNAEDELLNSHDNELATKIRPGHSKRIAAISIMAGKMMGLSNNDLTDLVSFSILHDNSLTEVNQEELEYMKYNQGTGYSENDFNIRRCIIAENNMKYVPFRTNNRDVILLHRECSDGSGPFEHTFDRTPIKAQLMHLAYMIEEKFDLRSPTKDIYKEILYFVTNETRSFFAPDLAETFTKNFKYKDLMHLSDNQLDTYLAKATKHFNDEYSFSEVRNLATLFARIVDFKQHYTCRHSIGVAENAENMAKFYGFPEDKKTRFYLAGALHDIGKLMIPNEILQKPAKLTDEEYLVMKRHVIYTYQILSQIHSKGMDEVVRWASNHHEKINGEGYPNGLTAKNLSKEEQIMTCCDIYQALTEKRAYKVGFSHEKAMEIMREMVLRGDLDNSIVEDMDQVFGGIQPDEAAPTATLMP